MSVDDFFGGGFEVLKKRIRTRTSKIQLKKTKKKTRLLKRKDEEAMKENLKKLEADDPEFYKYLKDNDNDLLDFEAVNPLDAISDDEGDEDDDEEIEKKFLAMMILRKNQL